jgi:hypothetical protein
LDGFASVQWHQAEEIYGELAWSWPDIDRVYDITERLESMHFIRTQTAMGGYIGVQPTYRGIVRATERAQSEAQTTLRELHSAGEVTNVDFKRELALSRDKDKGEFVRDVLGLGNVQLFGARRFLVVGFEDKTLTFHATPDACLTERRAILARSKPQPSMCAGVGTPLRRRPMRSRTSRPRQRAHAVSPERSGSLFRRSPDWRQGRSCWTCSPHRVGSRSRASTPRAQGSESK